MVLRFLFGTVFCWSIFSPPGLAAAPLIESATCLECHEGVDTTLAHTPHQLTTADQSSTAISVSCVNCHTGAEAHLDEPDVSTIGNPAGYSMAEAVSVCGSCHTNPHQLSMAEQNPHTMAGLNCSNCHEIHGPDGPSLKGRSTAKCLECHGEMRAEFELTSNHRVLEGVVACIDCHDLTRQLNSPFGDVLDRQCLSCHGELEGPYPYEHEATNAYSVAGGGCIECHQPHGSVFDRLLREPPTQLCLQCHVVPGHQTAHGGVFAGEGCLSCHTQIHGSTDNASYFPPGVPPGTCFDVGCHPLEGLK